MSPVQHRISGAVLSFSLEGSVEVNAEGKQWLLRAGELLALDGGVTHAVASALGGVFLLTVMHDDATG
jgi:quercetin dioxygenase-like cupin family protein